jgi:hypothetical protein
MNDRAKLVTSVMFALDSHKHQLIEMLFGDSMESYKQEWYRRTPVEFWTHLDFSNRQRVVQWASDFYADF